MTTIDALVEALEALETIALAGMSGSGQESEEGMRAWHARRAWEFIGIAARAKEKVTAALALARAEQAEPVAWQDHVEQRLLTWRQSFVNRSGDQLALDDFMDKRSLEDLIDFVCQEFATPPAAPAKLDPLSRDEIDAIWRYDKVQRGADMYGFVRAIEAAHNAKLGGA